MRKPRLTYVVATGGVVAWNNDDIGALLAPGHEQRNMEIKRGGPLSDDDIRTQVFRAMMALANRRYGGLVLLGIDEAANHQLTATGITVKDAATWNHDDIASKLRPYVDPYVDFDVYTRQWRGADVRVVEVREFSELPVLCAQPLVRDGKELVTRGALLVRSAGKHETCSVATQTEMREVIDLATEKMFRRISAIVGAGPVTPVGDPFADERGSDL